MNRKWKIAPRGLRRPADGFARAGFAVVLALLVPGVSAPAGADVSTFEAIRAADAAVARIGYTLATANADLCDRLEPGLGLVLHTPEQYARPVNAAAVRHFRFDGAVAVEAVIPGSPADRAGIRADDSIAAVGAARFAPARPGGEASTDALIAASRSVAALPPDRPVEVVGSRDGQAFRRTIEPEPACRTRFELVIESGFSALADGEMVQISSRFLDEYPEELVAAAIAHEFAHNILRHRERLEDRGVSFGMLAGLGRNVRYFRQTEIEADILSVALLANAGYDPAAALRFWEDFGPNHAGGILRSRSHPAWRDRVATIRHAIAALGAERPARPAILASRDRPLDGDWQGLLVKAR
jgi:hypothetical protein